MGANKQLQKKWYKVENFLVQNMSISERLDERHIDVIASN